MRAMTFDPSQAGGASFGGASVLDDLAWRGLIAHSTDLDALRAELATGPITLYCGFDPTAPSLHVGHLAQTLTARRFQLAGHLPLALVGGATGMIGDPKPTSERTLNEAEVVAAWSDGIRRQLERFFDFEGPAAARMVNNHDWTAPMSVIEFLRDIGKHFSVNRMLDREAVARRLADQGISFTEFSYVLLQSMDYLELFRRYGCRLQTGGSDQFGNIVAGVDLVRRVEGASVHALTTPLMTKADGTKFGKTEGGAVWLDPELTSPYAFYQFWLNTDDRDVTGNLRMFSFRTREEIEALDVEVAERPAARAGQRALAQELTEMVHGPQALTAVEAASRALFGSGELRAVPEATLDAALRETEFGELVVPTGSTVGAIDLLVAAGLAPSKGAARRTIAEGGASVNNVRIADESASFTHDDTLAGGWLVVRRGRRAVAGVRVVVD
jgi:tyrosyl-tRNA synthetase